jgi:hypothetical protein
MFRSKRYFDFHALMVSIVLGEDRPTQWIGGEDRRPSAHGMAAEAKTTKYFRAR